MERDRDTQDVSAPSLPLNPQDVARARVRLAEIDATLARIRYVAALRQHRAAIEAQISQMRLANGDGNGV